MKNKIVVLTGAGMSAESGIKTFRDADGLWEGHDVMEVASPQGFAQNPELVLDFYNQRRRQLLLVEPNAAHKALVTLETHFEVHIVTQNVDDLHERAGSSNVMHLHGELFKVRSAGNESTVLDWKHDLVIGEQCPEGHQLRPHIVWFGEMVPLLDSAAKLVAQADIIIIIGTSMQVYPAAGLVDYAKDTTEVFFIDPKPSISESNYGNLTVLPNKASVGVPALVNDLIHKIS